MKKEKKEKDFLHKPVYPGGIKAMRQWIRENLQYPEAARAAGVEGTVHLKYAINYQGKVTDVKVISGLGYGCDEEAARLVSQMRFEVPKNRKIKVLFHKKLQVHFRLQKPPSKPNKPDSPNEQPQIRYHYTSEETKEEVAENTPQPTVYRYTMRW